MRLTLFGTITKGGPGSGNFGHAGRPGEVGGSTPDGGSAPIASGNPKSVTDNLRSVIGADVRNIDIPSRPIAVSAANELTHVLTEMKSRGYDLPHSIKIQTVSGETPSARMRSGGPLSASGNELIVDIPDHLPDGANLDDSADLAFGGTHNGVRDFAINNFRDVVVHEMGHLQHRSAGVEDHSLAYTHGEIQRAWGIDRYEKAVLSVSGYSAWKPSEFVAEAFVKLYRGDTLTPDAAYLYKLFDGPQVKH